MNCRLGVAGACISSLVVRGAGDDGGLAKFGQFVPGGTIAVRRYCRRALLPKRGCQN